MRAVNLLPPDMRGAASNPARTARPEPVQGIGAYVVLGALALCVAALAGYILTSNGIKQREADLETAKARTTAATAKAAALKPYADFEALASARVETVRGLAAARFDWERALRDVSHAIPGDVKLTALNGDMGLPGAGGGGGDSLRGSIQAPAISMTGCASGQTGVARMMARIKAVDGVTRVSLSKSDVAPPAAPAAGANQTGAAPECGDEPATFSLVIFFERAAALSQFSSAAGAAAPVPNAVNQANGAASTAESTGAAATGDPAAATPPSATTTSTSPTDSMTTPTTPEATP